MAQYLLETIIRALIAVLLIWEFRSYDRIRRIDRGLAKIFGKFIRLIRPVRGNEGFEANIFAYDKESS